jgi:hypothetical protein
VELSISLSLLEHLIASCRDEQGRGWSGSAATAGRFCRATAILIRKSIVAGIMQQLLARGYEVTE